MRLIVHTCRSILGGIGVGGKGLGVWAGLVVLLDQFCPRCHDCSGGEDGKRSVQRSRGAIVTAELYAFPGREVIREVTFRCKGVFSSSSPRKIRQPLGLIRGP